MAFETVSTLGLHHAWLSIITKKSKKIAKHPLSSKICKV
jgi:hypothetical protein